MTRPALACGLARVHVYDRDGITSRGTITPDDLTWTRTKTVDGSQLSFTAKQDQHPAMVTDPAMLEDALAIIELDVGGVWTEIGTPYVLSAGNGTIIGTAEGSAAEHQPSGVGAALGLCGEWLVLHSGGEVNRRGPTERYIGWQSSDFDDSTWTTGGFVAADSFDITDAKYEMPVGWPDVAATAGWAKGDGTGPIVLHRWGSFTVTSARKYIVLFSADEEAKVYLDGPGWGGVIMTTMEQETGYIVKNYWSEVLQPGTYFLSSEMTTVASAGGDGFDGIRYAVGTADTKGRLADVVLSSTAGCTVKNVTRDEVRPGFTPADVVEKLRSENATWGIPSASLLTVAASGTEPAGKEWVWPSFTPVSQVISDLEVEVAFHVDTSWQLNVGTSLGTDKSATISLVEGADPATAGMNLEGYGWTSDPVMGTRAVVLTNDGYVEAIDTTAEAAVDARAMYLESGTSGSIAQGKAYALDAIDQSGKVRRAYTADVLPVTGKIPEVNFGVGDTIAALNYQKAATDLEVTAITGSNRATHAMFTVQLTEA